LVQNIGALLGFFSFGFLADAFGRKPTTFLYYLMCLVLTPIVYLWVQEIHLLLLVFAVYGFFIQGVFSWTPIWLPELFPTRMRATAAGFIFNAPRLISAVAPLIAGTLIAQSIDERMNFGGQSAARSADRLRAVFFRAPALC
jgi:MFS family permease